MAVHRLPVQVVVEVDDEARTVHVVVETPAGDSKQMVALKRWDITDTFAGPENAGRRRALRHLIV